MVAGILVLSACGDDGDDSEATTNDEEEAQNDDTAAEEVPDYLTWTAQAREGIEEIAVYAEPGGEGEPIDVLTNPFRVDTQDDAVVSPTPFLLVDEDVPPAGDAEWIEVHLPAPPTGSTGFISTEDVDVHSNPYRITVDRDAMTLSVDHNGEEIFEAQVGLGRDERSTEPGNYFLTELIASEIPDGAYGPYAFGINGFPEDPEIIAEFGEDATVGIHGTNEPDSIGSQVSSGCIRLNNDDITHLATEIRPPLGTPVDVI